MPCTRCIRATKMGEIIKMNPLHFPYSKANESSWIHCALLDTNGKIYLFVNQINISFVEQGSVEELHPKKVTETR